MDNTGTVICCDVSWRVRHARNQAYVGAHHEQEVEWIQNLCLGEEKATFFRAE